MKNLLSAEHPRTATGGRGGPGPTLADIRRAGRAGEDLVRRTPILASRSLSERAGLELVLKAENLQRTGSFKLRGALAKLASLDLSEVAGVVAGSAGNHAQSLAYAARARGVACQVFMPLDAAIAKAKAAEAFGALVRYTGTSVDECVAEARRVADRDDLVFVHPFDDPAVVAGQGTLGLELVEQVPDLARVVVPLGGGGLASGVAIAVKSIRPAVQVIGVQAQACASFPESLARRRPMDAHALPTIADGIAVKRPGGLTLRLVETWVDDVVLVSEQEIADAVVLLLERTKLVVEGAGAASLAAVLSGRVPPSPRGTTVAILSGGNIDVRMISALTRHHETSAGRRLVMFVRIQDSPGSLARLLTLLGDAGGNILSVDHMREGVDVGIGETGVQLALETRGEPQARELIGRVRESGYPVEVLPRPARHPGRDPAQNPSKSR